MTRPAGDPPERAPAADRAGTRLGALGRLSLLVLFLLLLSPFVPSPGAVRVFAASSLVLFWPGHLLRSLRPRAGPAPPSEEALLSVAASLLVLALVLGAGWISGTGPALAAHALPILATLLAVLAVILPPRRPAPRRLRARAAGERLVLGALAALVSFLVLFRGGPLGPSTDAPDHVAAIREVVSGRLLPTGELHYAGSDLRPDPRKGILTPALATVAVLSRTGPLEVWRWAPALVALLAVFAFAALARELLSGAPAALAATAWWVLSFGGGPGEWLSKSLYDGHAGIAFALYVAARALRATREAGAGDPLGIAFVSGAAALLHAFAPVGALVVSTGALLVEALARRGVARRAAIALGSILLGSIPILLLRLLLSGRPRNPLQIEPQGVLLLGPAGFVLPPVDFLAWHGPALLAAPIVLVLLAVRARRCAADARLLGASAAVLLVVFNPVLLRELVPRVGLIANKLMMVFPACALAAWPLGRLFGERRAGRAAAVPFLLLLLAPAAMTVRERILDRAHGPDRPPAWVEAIPGLLDGLPDGAVVLSDPATAYSIPAWSGARVPVASAPHLTPCAPQPLERLALVAGVLSPCVPAAEAWQAMDGLGIEYLVLHAEPRDVPPDFFLPFEGDAAAGVRRFLDAAPPRPSAAPRPGYSFRKVREKGGLVLVRRGPLPPAAEGDALCCAPAALRAVVPTGEGATDPAPDLALARFVPVDTVLAGGEWLELETAWKVSRRSPFPFEVELRLVHESGERPRGPAVAGGPAEAAVRPPPSVLARVRRSLEERRTGALRHLRERWRPCDAAHPTPLWKEGREYADRHSVRIPDRFAPGRYDVWISPRRAEMAPNVDAREWLSDVLPEAAVPVGTVTVR